MYYVYFVFCILYCLYLVFRTTYFGWGARAVSLSSQLSLARASAESETGVEQQQETNKCTDKVGGDAHKTSLPFSTNYSFFYIPRGMTLPQYRRRGRVQIESRKVWSFTKPLGSEIIGGAGKRSYFGILPKVRVWWSNTHSCYEAMCPMGSAHATKSAQKWILKISPQVTSYHFFSFTVLHTHTHDDD